MGSWFDISDDMIVTFKGRRRDDMSGINCIKNKSTNEEGYTLTLSKKPLKKHEGCDKVLIIFGQLLRDN